MGHGQLNGKGPRAHSAPILGGERRDHLVDCRQGIGKYAWVWSGWHVVNDSARNRAYEEHNSMAGAVGQVRRTNRTCFPRAPEL